MNKDQIVVYILSPDPNSQRTAQVQSLFDDKRFHINIANISPPADLQSSNNWSTNSDKLETYRVKWCLHHAQQHHPTNYIIISKDTSISSVPSDVIADQVSSIIHNKSQNSEYKFDLFYLCKWLDRCDLYTGVKPIEGTSSLVMQTYSPRGFQCIMLSPRGRDVVLGQAPMTNGKYFSPNEGKSLASHLNDAIMNRNIQAFCIHPNLIDYDITAAKSQDDYRKLSECQFDNKKNYQEDIGSNSGSNFNNGLSSILGLGSSSTYSIWVFIAVIIILILIIWAVTGFYRP